MNRHKTHMRIFLIRHGDYILPGMEKAGDLSVRGIDELKREVKFLKSLNLKVSNILHSGKPRADQTAQILCECFQSAEPARMHKGLNPEDPLDDIINDINNWGGDLVLVGHLPFMGRLLGKLVMQDETKELVSFTPGTIVCLEGDVSSYWEINWVIKPSLFI